jgi:hypothetical protein
MRLPDSMNWSDNFASAVPIIGNRDFKVMDYIYFLGRRRTFRAKATF